MSDDVINPNTNLLFIEQSSVPSAMKLNEAFAYTINGFMAVLALSKADFCLFLPYKGIYQNYLKNVVLGRN